jgi:hypothetical protein
MQNILSIITFTPAVAAAILALFLRGNDATSARNARWLALIASAATFLISLALLKGFNPADTGFQFVEERPWIIGLTYKMGVDGISILFVMLTTALMPLTIAACWTVETRVKDYMIAFLLLRLLRGRPDPDVPDHRHLGRAKPHLCRVQVLPLHLPRLGPDAGGHDRHVPGRRHHRHRQTADL